MKKVTKGGFTLIELLVVIAIIGILSSVVLVSLNSARNKGKAASAQASMTSMRAAAELGVDASGAYTDPCDGDLTDLIAAVNNLSTTDVVCTDAADAWAAEIDMSGIEGTGYFCVDSTGFAGPRTTSKAAATACPAS